MVLTPVQDMGYARIGRRLSENKILVYVMFSPTALRACKVNPIRTYGFLPFTQKSSYDPYLKLLVAYTPVILFSFFQQHFCDPSVLKKILTYEVSGIKISIKDVWIPFQKKYLEKNNKSRFLFRLKEVKTPFIMKKKTIVKSNIL